MSENNLEILKCGTKVVPKLNNTEAIITAVSLRFDKVSYEVSYFYNGEYKVIWLHETEFEVDKTQKQSIGFK